MRTKNAVRKISESRERQAPHSSSSQPTKRPRGEQTRKISDEKWSKERRQRLEKLTFSNNEHLDQHLLRAYGLEERIRPLLNVGPWSALVGIREPAFREVTLEFLSTFRYTSQGMRFQVYGKDHCIPPNRIGSYLGLYSDAESLDPEFIALTNDWPQDVTPQSYWHELVQDADNFYNPSKSKASTIVNVNMRVLHHLLAHTIGSRKTSHGVVNTFEIFHMYSMENRWRIDVGREVAKFFQRQATDPRVKGIYCGGYVTKLLKGCEIFQDPGSVDHIVASTRISDGPFRVWGIAKLIDQPSASRFSTPTRGVSSPHSESTPRSPAYESEIQKLRQELKEERQLTQKERRKNKRFRAAVWSFLGKLAGCFSPPPTDLPTYESSPEQASAGGTTAAPPGGKGKAIIEAESSSSEEEEEGEEEGEDEEDSSEDGD